MPKIVDHEMRREEIAHAAVEAISDMGIDSVKLTDIAVAAGWTTGVLTHYFAGKGEILLAAARLVNQRLLDRIGNIRVESVDNLLEVAIEALPMDDLRLTEWRAWLSFWDEAVTDSALGVEIRRQFDQWTRFAQGLLQDGIDQGLLDREIDPRLEADRFLAIVDGIGLQAALNPEAWPAERQVRAVRDYICGLAASDVATSRCGE
jgi:TetR/AcrR family transcriptional repressor of bet genes